MQKWLNARFANIYPSERTTLHDELMGGGLAGGHRLGYLLIKVSRRCPGLSTQELANYDDRNIQSFNAQYNAKEIISE